MAMAVEEEEREEEEEEKMNLEDVSTAGFHWIPHLFPRCLLPTAKSCCWTAGQASETFLGLRGREEEEEAEEKKEEEEEEAMGCSDRRTLMEQLVG